MKKNILKITLLIMLASITAGCGEIPEEAREDEKNYKEMIEKDFSYLYSKEFTIINDETVKSTFTSFGNVESVDEHIIDAVLKDDPTFSFRICTGFSEVPTFKVVYDYKTNYKNLKIHKLWNEILKNNGVIKLNSQKSSQTLYSSCTVDIYNDYLIFNSSSTVEEIATALYNLDLQDVYVGDTDFVYGNIDYCISIDKDYSIDTYINNINKAIEKAQNDDEEYRFCP